MSPFRSLDPAQLEPRERYALLTGAVQPRPIAFVSTLSPEGIPNLAPFSFFNVGGANPASLVFCPTIASGGHPKDTLRNVEATGEFVVNVLTRAMAEGMNRTSATFPPEVSEWDVAGFTPVPSSVVRPARVAESPVHLECRLHQIVRHGDGPGSAAYVIGEVVRMHFSEHLLDGSRLVPDRLRPIARLGGAGYVDLESLEVFDLPRP